MKIFMDTEFTGLTKDTDLISVGLVTENGDTFYGEFNDYREAKINKWLQKNVVANLRFVKDHYYWGMNSDQGKIEVKASREDIANYLHKWFQFVLGRSERLNAVSGDKIEMWGDCVSYDWVLFCDLWGHAFDIPKCISYIPLDICTLFKDRDLDPHISREEFIADRQLSLKVRKHNALYDAQVIKGCYYKLQEM